MQRLHDVVNKFVLELGVTYSKHTLQDCYYNQISRCPPTSCLPLPTESDKQVEKILHRCLLKKQAILSEQGVLCFSYIYIRPTAEEYQYNIPPKNPVVQMLKNFFLHCSTFTKCFYSKKYHRFTYMLHVRFQVFSHSCM